MPSTDTSESPSLIQRAMNRPLGERLAEKSVKLKQATEAAMVTDAAAGLAENRRTTKAYNKQADRATEKMVSNWIGSNGGGNAGGGSKVPDDEETVNLDLGDRYQEIHHHHPPAVTSPVASAPTQSPVSSAVASTPAALARTAGRGVLRKAMPWLLAGALGPLGALAGAAGTSWFNVKDVQSKFKVEVYDQNGKLIETLPYSELPKQ